MQPTRELPANYRRLGGIDLSSQVGLAVALTLLAIAAFGVGSLLLGVALRALRPDLPAQVNLGLTHLLAVAIVVVLVHEAVHGVFFWIITGEPPRFGLRALYAYAAAPGWYIPRGPYLVVGLGPLVLLSALGGVVLLVARDPFVLALVAAGTSLNAAGSVGDLAIVALVLRQSPEALVVDAGPGVAVYGPAPQERTESAPRVR